MLFLFFFSVLFVFSGTADASCSFAEQAEKSGKMKVAYVQYIYCAEEENDAEAQYKLGEMFYKGIGLPRPDFRRAVAFFSRSAKNGYAPAQVKLGLLYWRGEGIEKNLKMAHKWLYLAQEPADMRWFYYIGPSFDQSAAAMYAKINKLLASDRKDEGMNFLPEGVLWEDLKIKVIPSYKEVAEFQHEKMTEAGRELLDKRSQRDLQMFLNGLKPDVNPSFPPEMPLEQKQAIRRSIINWFKPVLLTEKNLIPAQIPVLEQLKNEIEKPAD